MTPEASAAPDCLDPTVMPEGSDPTAVPDACSDYVVAIREYGKRPSEPLHRPVRLAVFLALSLAAAVILAASELPGSLVVLWWEEIALFNTLIFSCVYFSDLWKDAQAGLVKQGVGLIFLTSCWFLNLFFIAVAMIVLWMGFYVAYLLLVTMSFGMFALLDYIFARDSCSFRKVREYRSLFLFVDLPASIAFVLVLLIWAGAHNRIDKNLLSGAVVMQMLIADALFLFVASNAPHWLLAVKLSAGTTKP